MAITHGSFFTCTGGVDLAAEEAGYKNLFYCESDPNMLKHLDRRFPNVKAYNDIRKFNGNPYRNAVDIISGGFPCQDISIAQTNFRDGAPGIKGKKSGLWFQYARVLREIMPGIVYFENSSMLFSRGFEYILCDFSQLGYDVEWRLLYASQFGYPHFRARLFGLAYSKRHRFHKVIEKGGILQKIPFQRTSRQNGVPMPSKRYDGQSDYRGVLLDDGFSSELDHSAIFGYGNAIVVDITRTIFETLNKAINDLKL